KVFVDQAVEVGELNFRAASLQRRQRDAVRGLLHLQVVQAHGFAGQFDVLNRLEQVVLFPVALFQGGEQGGFHLRSRLREIFGPRDERRVPIWRWLPWRDRGLVGKFRRKLTLQSGDVAAEAQLEQVRVGMQAQRLDYGIQAERVGRGLTDD